MKSKMKIKFDLKNKDQTFDFSQRKTQRKIGQSLEAIPFV